MKNVLSWSELINLNAGFPALENFGPKSDNPFLAIDLTGSDNCLTEWLTHLPCPVIGIGPGDAAVDCDVVLDEPEKLDLIASNVDKAPIAAMVLVQHLRQIEGLSLREALVRESFAYAAIQQGPEFKTWLAGYEGGSLVDESGPPILTDIEGGTLTIRLNRPKNYNAIGTEMRDALCEVLDMVLTAGSFSEIHITGNGKAFSIGGAIQEFGEVTDPATAHWVRSLRLPANRLAQLSENLSVHVNGAAVGAGVEIAAFAKRISCASNAWFQLPELKYGLIPGAGGTVSVTRRIGRQKCAYMALSMEKVSAKTAREWGLVDEIN